MNNFELYKLRKAGLKNHHILNVINYYQTYGKSLSLRNMAVASETSDPIQFIETYKTINSKALRKEFNQYPSISLLDKNYPSLLKEIYNPPVLLFYQGDLELLNYTKLAVVGSRKSSPLGLKVTQKIIEELNNKLIIVSGLARGVDTAAHCCALKTGGRTIAVIGSGFNHYYPKENQRLQKFIASNHLLLTEYGPNDPPLSIHFPERNRIIACLVKAVLVIEAKSRSGSLITCRYALENGREVFAVPGNISDSFSDGCNQLIQEGAKCIMSGLDVLTELF
ncbi:SMF family protein [Streptococcus pseudoporcinus]|uniref:SMF family protein n=1 Tax=Streptococcus pseudoporcinus TaxID=361101 RepID=A0A4U9YG75_9STRE|nr:DNA-processing protein DprA [Streptococcus pseudoporcinus]VTS25154.1 SMF family protein [Streptococcus pseudoporcinus]